MLILNEADIIKTGIHWEQTIDVIEQAVKCLKNKDYAQPIKPYLRYNDLKNRIIAMPAFVGGEINMAGIKWISSFPDNINKGLARAHSVIILNDADTGQPVSIINTALLSVIRTASVSGLMIRHFARTRTLGRLKIGITGFGPIGRYHLDMCLAMLGSQVESVCVYDIRAPDQNSEYISNLDKRVQFVSSWEDAYQDADIFISCTVSTHRYIDQMPKAGSLHLNVSLRDYKKETYQWFQNSIIVDDWEEICRENTDIEMMHLEQGLQEEDTQSIADVVEENGMEKYDSLTPIMFNPMGMAIFDIALGKYYYQANSPLLQEVSTSANLNPF